MKELVKSIENESVFLERQKVIDAATILSSITMDKFLSNPVDVIRKVFALNNDNFYTPNHLLNCGVIVEQFLDSPFSRDLDIDGESLRVGALCHDIGKIMIPENILLNKKELTIPEFNIIKLHPSLSFEILNMVPWVKGEAKKIALYHHIKINGSGYPLLLEGEEVSDEAYILAGIDVYETLTGHRHFREPINKKEAILEMKEENGHYYPRVFNFLCCFLESKYFEPKSLNQSEIFKSRFQFQSGNDLIQSLAAI